MKVTMTSDEKIRETILKGLKESGGYCPCRKIRTPETKCKCQEFKNQIANGVEGECHCGLFIATKD